MKDSGALAGRIVVRLFRSWAASRQGGTPALARMAELADGFGLSYAVAPECARLFELVEGHLGRPLDAECCCSPHLSTDERALIGLVLMQDEAGPEPTRSNPCDAIREAASGLRQMVSKRSAPAETEIPPMEIAHAV